MALGRRADLCLAESIPSPRVRYDKRPDIHEAFLTRVRADLLAGAAQNVERRLKPMPSFPALVRQYAVLLWKIASIRLLGSPPEGQALDIGLHKPVYRD